MSLDEAVGVDEWTPDWSDGDEPAGASRRRQVGVIAAIVAATVIALVGLVIAGAALLHEVSVRTNHHSASYRFGVQVGTANRDIAVQGAIDADTAGQLCDLLISQAPGRPAGLDVGDAVEGCAAAIR